MHGKQVNKININNRKSRVGYPIISAIIIAAVFGLQSETRDLARNTWTNWWQKSNPTKKKKNAHFIVGNSLLGQDRMTRDDRRFPLLLLLDMLYQRWSPLFIMWCLNSIYNIYIWVHLWQCIWTGHFSTFKKNVILPKLKLSQRNNVNWIS